LTKQLPFSLEQPAGLALADGTAWGIIAGDETATVTVSRLVQAMQLRPCNALIYRLCVFANGDGAYTLGANARYEHPVTLSWNLVPSDDDHAFACFFSPAPNNDMLVNQLIRLSLYIVRQTQRRGGFLLHGALAEKDGCGVILAGPGGVGKTTASRRLPSSWRSLSDDATLVVCDEKGAYWAHPWPTWSYFMSEGPGGTWDVNHAVPLKAIFFLQQAHQNRVEPVAPGQSACLLVELAEHTSWSMAHGEGKDVARTLRLERFENICTLVKDVPCYYLHLGLHGAFWKEIERVITAGSKGYSVNKSPLLRFQHFQKDAGLIFSDHTTVSAGMSGKEPGSVYFCAHFGTSMNPTLCELDVLEIESYGNQAVRVGDVIFFVPPGWSRPAVHRVVRVTSEGIRTRGDNNNRMDTWVLRPENVIGQVVRAARGKRRRPIYGGIAGRLWAFGVRVFKVLLKFPSLVYHLLARSGLFRYLLPLHKRMRVISINQTSGRELQLLLGRWLVGRRKPGMEQWWIRRPFRLFIDEASLPQ
jgi:hypothetical protein